MLLIKVASGFQKRLVLRRHVPIMCCCIVTTYWCIIKIIVVLQQKFKSFKSGEKLMNKTLENENRVNMRTSLSADDFLYGIIAALSVNEYKRISATQHGLHYAFYKVLKKLDEPEFKNVIDVDLSKIDFDPLYGLSRWFDRALTRAKRDFLVRFPNPSYNLIDISIGKSESEKMLSGLGSKEAFLKLATLFHHEIAVS